MKFHIERLGPISDATIDLGDLTIVCGKNNTGKSYLTYSMYGALDFLRDRERFTLPESNKKELLSTGTTRVDLQNAAGKYWRQLEPEERKKFLEGVIPPCMGRKNLAHDGLAIDFSDMDSEEAAFKQRLRNVRYDLTLKVPHEDYSLSLKKGKGDVEALVQYTPEASALKFGQGTQLTIPSSLVNFAQWVVGVLVSRLLPRPFILSSERTGISVFRDEFLYFRSFAYENNAPSEGKEALRKRFAFSDYPIPVRKDIEFSLQLASVQKSATAFLAKKAKVFELFEEIAGGSYSVDKDSGLLRFTPRDTPVALSMNESSSSVRSLCELFFYLKYAAEKGDVLIIDEPEMNLHPGAQRRLARLLALLAAKCGIRVLLTTHSDYIIREINALVNLGLMPKERRSSLLDRHNYHDDMLLEPDRVKIYVIENGGATPVNYDEEALGFAVPSFDDTIEDFNRLYCDIRSSRYEQES